MTVFVTLEARLWLMCQAFTTDPKCRKGMSPVLDVYIVMSTVSRAWVGISRSLTCGVAPCSSQKISMYKR